MLEALGYKIELMRIYLGVADRGESMSKVVVDVFVEIIVFWSQIVQTLSKNPLGEYMTVVKDDMVTKNSRKRDVQHLGFEYIPRTQPKNGADLKECQSRRGKCQSARVRSTMQSTGKDLSG